MTLQAILEAATTYSIDVNSSSFWTKISLVTRKPASTIKNSARLELDKLGFPGTLEGFREWLKSEKTSLKDGHFHKSEVKWDKDGSQSITSISTRIRTVQDIIEYHDIDVTKYDVHPKIAGSYEGQQKDVKGNPIIIPMHRMEVRIVEKPKEVQLYAKLREWITSRPKSNKVSCAGKGEGIVAFSDLHFGAEIKAFLNTKDFNKGVLLGYLDLIVEDVNEQKFKSVDVFMLGDFIESFSGLNHDNTWQELESYGVDATISVFEMLDYILSRVKNLRHIKIVGGNHDRTQIKKNLDMKSGAASLISYMMKMAGYKVEYSPLCISTVVDGICYILFHGDFNLSKQEISQIILDYGKQGMFNVVIKGHEHSLKMITRKKNKKEKVEDITITGFEYSNSIMVTLRALFTGGFYSASSGWSGSAGASIFWNRGTGKPQVLHTAY